MSDDIPEHWADLSKDQKRVIVEMADGRLWWIGLWSRAGGLRNIGVVVMAIFLFLQWGRDALAHWLNITGGPKP